MKIKTKPTEILLIVIVIMSLVVSVKLIVNDVKQLSSNKETAQHYFF